MLMGHPFGFVKIVFRQPMMIFFTALIHNCICHEVTETLCGARSLTNKIASEATWVHKGSNMKPYYQECNLIHARYNCSRFRTSATQYQLHFPVYSNRKSNCRVPSYPLLYRILGRRNTNIFMIGDSHMQQIFESLLCIFKSRVRDIITFQRDGLHSTGPVSAADYVLHKYADYNGTPSCHTIMYANYHNFRLGSFADPAMETSTGECTLSHFAGQTSCFKLPTLVDRNYSLFCFSYIRPLRGMDAVQSGTSQSFAQVNVSINDFHVVIANTYISSAALATYLSDSNYTGRVIVIPRFPFANQSNTVYRNWTLTAAVNVTEVTKSTENVQKFCHAFEIKVNHSIPHHHRHRAVNDSHLQFGQSIAYYNFSSNSNSSAGGNSNNSSHGESTENPCVPLDFSLLLHQRNGDSKSSIFPLTFVDEASQRLVECQATQTSPNTCEGRYFRVCNFERCNEESHFCMPGPTDELSLLLLAASISHKDHNHHLHR